MSSHRIRTLLFVFHMMEALANMVLMRFNLTALYMVYKNLRPLPQELLYFFYLALFYIFGLLNLLAAVNLCTSDQPLILDEVMCSLISCFLYVICSMLGLFDAESDLDVIKANRKPNDQKALHPYFRYNHLYSQGMASMVCSGIHVLHFLVAFYVLLFSEGTVYDFWIWNYLNS